MSKNAMKRRYQYMSFTDGTTPVQIVHTRKPEQRGLAGMITSKAFPDRIALIADDQLLEVLNADFACLGAAASGNLYRLVMEREVFFDFKRGSAMARLIVFHELGHYVHGDLKKGFTSESYDESRAKAAQGNTVLHMELAADQYAADYLGCDIAVKGLQELRAATEARWAGNEEIDQNELTVALSELDARIAALR